MHFYGTFSWYCRNTGPYQVSIFIHGHSKWPHAHEKPLIIVINHPLVLLPDDLPLLVVLHNNTKHITTTLMWLRAHVHPVSALVIMTWSLSHNFIIGDAMPDLPDLPLGQDLVRVWRHILRAAQQDKKQSCPQQEADVLPCRRNKCDILIQHQQWNVKLICTSPNAYSTAEKLTEELPEQCPGVHKNAVSVF